MGTNEYGLDVSYFQKWIKRELLDIRRHTPDELARTLIRMAHVADSQVIREPEFSKSKAIYGKQRGHHCWWLTINGKEVANFDLDDGYQIDDIIATVNT